MNAGSRIRVGDSTVLVKQVVNPTLIVLTVNNGPDVVVTDRERVTLMPEVFVFAGLGRIGSRLAFEAPKRIEIHRVGVGNGTRNKQ